MGKSWDELTPKEKQSGYAVCIGIVIFLLIFVNFICGDDSDDVADSDKEIKPVAEKPPLTKAAEVKSIETKIPESKNQNIPCDLIDPNLNSGLEIEYKDIIGRWYTTDDNSGGFTFTDDLKVYIHVYNDGKKAWSKTKNPGRYTLDKDILTIVLYGDKTELEVIRFNQDKIILMNWETHSLSDPIEYPTNFIHWNRRNLPF